jgi:hypothetical protein
MRTERISHDMAKTLANGFGVIVGVLKALGTPEGEHYGTALAGETGDA